MGGWMDLLQLPVSFSGAISFVVTSFYTSAKVMAVMVMTNMLLVRPGQFISG